MIPLKLQVRNFMCYRELDSLDFSGIDLARVAGDNGHGKSALLDAIIWALWGKARAKRDDELGTRSYELYSGGESFRVNFAIRIALSKLLARRAGARLQTLVIDEGFGTQDAQGRERLVEAINSTKEDFERILVITHIEELKDAFPVRIDVFKTPQGSQVAIN